MAVDWKVALPLHPEYRTLPMVWYVPPLSPIQAAANAGQIGAFGELPDVRSLRIPLRYLANLLTAGDEAPVVAALERMLAMRAYMRDRHVEQRENAAVLQQVGLTVAQVEDMYRYMAIANYEDRFVIPTTHREYAEDAYALRGGCGFSFGKGCDSDRHGQEPVRRQRRAQDDPDQGRPMRRTTMTDHLQGAVGAARLPDAELVAALPEIRDAHRRRPPPAAARCGRPRRAGRRAGRDRPARRAGALRRHVRPRARRPRCTCSSTCTASRATAAPAMVDLKGDVRARGLRVRRASELPDYLPAVLEFLSTQPHEAAEELLGDCAHILRTVGEALAERGRPTRRCSRRCSPRSAPTASAAQGAPRIARPEKSIDEEWAEEPVIFGPAAGARVRRADARLHPSSSSCRARAKPRPPEESPMTS